MTTDPEDSALSGLSLEASVFAAYGGAMAAISTVERNLHLAHVNQRLARARQEGTVLTAEPFAKAARLSFSELVKKVTPLCDRDPALASELATAVKRRNYLVHDLWFQKVYAMLGEETQRALLTELLRDNAVFEDINDRLVKSVVDPGLEARGVDPAVGEAILLATLKAYEEQNE